MDILKREMAPITDAAWAEIDEEAARTLRVNLSARGIVDFSGPHGWDLSNVNLGRVKTGKAAGVKGVEWGTREVLPLVEIRVALSLNQWDLDDVSRGAEDPDLDALVEAARNAAMFEEKAIYGGFKNGQITGIVEASTHAPVPLSKAPDQLVANVQDAVGTLRAASIEGDYALVLGTEAYKMVAAGDENGYPLRRRLRELIGGDVHWSPAVDCGVVVSQRGGDYRMTVGQDWSIGYAASTEREVKLYLTESFTFQVFEPAAAVELKWAGK